MHSMTGSAGLRERRRQETSSRIAAEARRLTDQHGLDHWTMDELADAVGVSRRTLFNHVAGKVDAVLGPPPQLPKDLVDTFRAGGPTGELIEDVAVLALAAVSGSDDDRESLAIGRRLLRRTPRLLLAAHERFEAMTQEFAEVLLARPGEPDDEHDAKLLLRLLVSLHDSALDQFLAEPVGRGFADHYEDALSSARRLLA
jgi:AcrR family transcriptional regulator